MDTLQHKKILILDRSKVIRENLAADLAKAGAEVQNYDSSESALLDIIHWHPDVIITSVEVGTISGFDLCLILKLMPEYAAIPIIIISSGEKDVVKHRASDVGADFYVPKDQKVIENTRRILDTIWLKDKKPEDRVFTQIDKPGKILLVDDSKVMRRIIRNMLNSLGIQNICEAKDGVEGLEQLEEHYISLVLTDWNMPRMNGLDFVKALREKPEFSALPVIMVTTEGGDKEREQASEAGADGHIKKPFSTEKIKEVISLFSEHISL